LTSINLEKALKRLLQLCLFISLLVCQSLAAQIRIEVKVDTLLLSDQYIYLASSLNNWNPKDPQWMLRKIGRDTYSIEIDEDTPDFEYKFTQGNWNIVEGSKEGGIVTNRHYTKSDATNGIIYVNIPGWESRPEFEITVVKVPDNTPHDASIYISGNFNNWEIKDELFKLQKQFDGSYKIKIYSKFENLEYKFHRGDWNSAESWQSGRARPNRILNVSRGTQNSGLEIENWEDLSSTFNFFSLIDLLLLFAAFQSFLLMIAIPTMQDFNREANKLLVILLGMAAFFLFFRVLGYYREVANTLPKMILIPNFVLFLYAPLFYFYLNKLLFNKSFSTKQALPHFFLSFLLFMAYIPYFFMDGKRFQHKIVNNENDLKWVLGITFVIALFSNLYYYFRSKRAIQKYSDSYINETAYHQNINYLSTVLVIFLVCIVLGFFTAILYILNIITGNTLIEPADNSINLIWIAFSLIGFLLGYYAIHQPEIFKINSDAISLGEVVKPEVNKTKNAFAETELDQHKAQIEDIMKSQKPFMNPNLTLNDLASLMKIPSHVLSKIIKEGYNVNFFDFINSYRIEEFKENINNPKYHNYTLLGIAFEVGFNSKTAFNRSFKKMTNQTPSEYYQSRK
jgi:AraC-like DNA-binding protein